jgi:glycerophosphoryl diester phosphodiesterase
MHLKIIAHRGYSAIAPENTKAAFMAAIEHQVAGIECDVQLTGDRLPVIIHDHTLDRTTNGQGEVHTKTLSELQELDAGSWFSPKFKQEKILTLEATLNLLLPTGLQIYAEIKNTQNWTTEDINNLLNLLLKKNALSQCAIISFDEYFLQEIRQKNVKVNLGYLSKNITEYQEKLSYVKSKSDLVLPHYQILLENNYLIDEAKKQGNDLIVWTVDKQQDLNKLVKLGIENIITNSLIN